MRLIRCGNASARYKCQYVRMACRQTESKMSGGAVYARTCVGQDEMIKEEVKNSERDKG